VSAATDVVVPTSHGPVRGTTDGQMRSWLGIRYAAPPTGPRRWGAPQAPESWTEPADATRFAAMPPQATNPVLSFPAGTRFDEDCLFLNVWAAQDATPQHPRPVLVWIHGGAYVFGGTAQQMSDGRALALTGEVVVVSVAYRLGALGFLDVTGLGVDSAIANPALADVIQALSWVRENIAGFGGDADAVTIFGESAGAGIVTTLMTTPAAAGLFVRAIADSSPATSVYGQDRSRAIGRRAAEALGAAGNPRRLFELPADALVAAGQELFADIPHEDPGTLAFAPVVDDVLVPAAPVDVFARGGAHPVPLLIGTNRDETSLFQRMKSPLMPVSREALAGMTADLRVERPDLDIPTDAEIAAAYAGLGPRRRGPAISRDLGFRMPTVWVAEGHAAVAPTYLYRFDWTTPMLRMLGIGATHGTELPYVWGHLAQGPRDITFRLGGLRAGRLVSARMQARWLGFAANGVPDAAGAGPDWPAYTPPERRSLRIDHVDEVVVDMDADARRAWGSTPLSFP
jgi:para-nitrobenzyl esterase